MLLSIDLLKDLLCDKPDGKVTFPTFKPGMLEALQEGIQEHIDRKAKENKN